MTRIEQHKARKRLWTGAYMETLGYVYFLHPIKIGFYPFHCKVWLVEVESNY